MSPKTARWGGPAGIAAGLLWAVALTFSVLGELEYQGSIERNPIPDALGLPAFPLAALATGLALWCLQTRLVPATLGSKTAFGIAYAGTAFSFIPLWPATFLGPVLLALGLVLIGLAVQRSDLFESTGSTIHMIGFPAVVIATPILGALGIDGLFGLGLFAAVLSGGLIWIGIDLNEAQQEDPDMLGAAA